jgi:hypothetical protein
MTTFANKVANGSDSGRDALNIFRSYTDVFGPAFTRAVETAERRGGRKVTPARKPAAKATPKPRTRTVTRTVVRDAGWRAKYDEARALKRSVEDQLKAALRDLDRQRELAELRARELAVALGEAREMTRLRKRLHDVEETADELRGRLQDAERADGAATERARATAMVLAADARAEKAEARAGQVEREMAEQAAAITGEVRRLTAAELAELKLTGPAGSTVLAAALKKLAIARAEGGKGPLAKALGEVRDAAEHYRRTL